MFVSYITGTQLRNNRKKKYSLDTINTDFILGNTKSFVYCVYQKNKL